MADSPPLCRSVWFIAIVNSPASRASAFLVWFLDKSQGFYRNYSRQSETFLTLEIH